MKWKAPRFEQVLIARHLLRWTAMAIPLALVTGSLVALFLWLLEVATATRIAHPWLLYLLPLAGIGIWLLYRYAGKNAGMGNNLVMNEIHEPGGGVPARMAPLVLLTTVVTHLFGGSAGREGTAVQMGGSMAALLGRWCKLQPADMRVILMMGISGGFGAVFGTPVAGAVFALEVLAVGIMRYNALVPCLVASVLSDVVCAAWGIHHTHYHIETVVPQLAAALAPANVALLVKVIGAGVAFGLAGFVFAQMQHNIGRLANRLITIQWLVPAIGGIIIIGLCVVLDTRDYLGLGVYSYRPGAVSIVSAFTAGGATYFSWFWKLLFTAVTLGMGFKGGEVTPLFFIGATLGNAIAMLAGAPVDLFAGLGFVAVFAGATNTPLACTLMAVELFGGQHVFYFAIACFTAYYFSGHSGIYSSQRIGIKKGNI